MNPINDPRFWEKSLQELDFSPLDPALGPQLPALFTEPGSMTSAEEQALLAEEYRRQHGYDDLAEDSGQVKPTEHTHHMLHEMRRNGRRSARRRGFMRREE